MVGQMNLMAVAHPKAYDIGIHAEQYVKNTLNESGWKILAHRARTQHGEIDIIARRYDTIIFVEVKASTQARPMFYELITQRVQLRLRRAAVAWMSENPQLHRGAKSYRFDVAFVQMHRQGDIKSMRYIRQAF